MAKRHVVLRFAQAEAEYLDMLHLLKELKEDLDSGAIPQDYYTEKAEIVEAEIDKIKLQYFFWGEALFELNKPNKRTKEDNDHIQDWLNALTTQTVQALKADKDPLTTLKTILEEGKKKHD